MLQITFKNTVVESNNIHLKFILENLLAECHGKYSLHDILIIFNVITKYKLRVHDWHNDGVFIKATKSLKIVVLTCYLSHSPKIHR